MLGWKDEDFYTLNRLSVCVRVKSVGYVLQLSGSRAQRSPIEYTLIVALN